MTETILRFQNSGVMLKMGSYVIIRSQDKSEPAAAYVNPKYAKQFLDAINRDPPIESETND